MNEKTMMDGEKATDSKSETEITTSHVVMLPWSQQYTVLWTSKRAVWAAFACSSSAVLIGYDMTLIGSIIANKTFVQHFGRYDDGIEAWTLPASRQLIWSIVQFVSAMAGAMTVGTLNDILGRRICFLITVILTFVGAITELLSPGWKVWIAAKIFFGSAMGFMQGNTPTYISEIAPIHLRGFMLSLFQFWIIFGSFLASCVLEGTSKIEGQWSWKAAIVSQFGLGCICLLVFIPLVPESPYYLANKGRAEKARGSLLTLRGGEADYSPEADLAIIEETLRMEAELNEEDVSYIECFKGSNFRRTMLACLPMISQMFLGYPLCGNYLAYFLTLSGVTNSFAITAINNTISMFAVLVAFVLIEKVGRRVQYLSGIAGMLPCLLGIGILGFVNVGSSSNGKALAALAILWNVGYFLSVGAVGWALVGEISSSRLRAKTTAIAVVVNSLFNMAFSIGIPYLINADEANLGPKAGFVFLGPSIVLAIISYFCIPEVKGKSFAELDALFESRTPARKF
ncbi:general substrate transporter [Leptodontidium sp. MPI-SDFR-AT-0119]|nr:general substrate transporter [Leptodontidium sp. MPI-SDFR-AT-0119]